MNRWSNEVLMYKPCENITEEEFIHFAYHIGTQGFLCDDFSAY